MPLSSFQLEKATLDLRNQRVHVVDRPPNRLLQSDEDYSLLKIIGRGGMGVVYLAEQRSLRRQVALKVLTSFELGQPDALARFRSEAETLARLRHANIVQVHDSGTRDGVPFLAMEYVPGGSLAELIRTSRPSARQAAEWISQVARAVQHAHDQGIIHRDLKPANILLAGAVPKVADFGLALDSALPRLTQTGHIAGTPPYMAPEQLSGTKHLTRAIDIYALGVVLHELLTGAVPFAGDTPIEILSQVTGREALPLRTWQPNLARDLDTICRKCLRKEADARYRTAAEFADDLDRFLAGRPILARPVGTIGRAWRWCRRNPVAAGLAGSVAATLLIGSIVSLSLAQWALGERARAETKAQEAEASAVAERLAKEQESAERAKAVALAKAEAKAREGERAVGRVLWEVVAAFEPDGGDLRGHLYLALSNAAKQLRQVEGDANIQAELQHRIGVTFQRIGFPASALPLLESAYARRPNESARPLANALIGVGRVEDAVVLLESTYARRLTDDGPDHPETTTVLRDLAAAHFEAKRYHRALEMHQRNFDAKVRTLSNDDPSRAIDLVHMASCLTKLGQPQNALPLFEQADAIYEAKKGPNDPISLWMTHQWAVATLAAGDTKGAIARFRGVVELKSKVLGQNHPETLKAIGFLASALERTSPAESLLLKEQALAGQRESLGPATPETINAMIDLARRYELAGQVAKAVPLREWILKQRLDTAGEAHRDTLWARHSLAYAYEFGGQLHRAVGEYEKARAGFTTLSGRANEDTVLMTARVGTAYRQTGQTERAVELLAEAWGLESKSGRSRKLGVWLPLELGFAYEQVGDIAKAEAPFRASVEAAIRQHGPSTIMHARSSTALAANQLSRGQAGDAEPHLDLALKCRERAEPDRWSTFETKSLYGDALARLKKPGAEAPLVAGYEGLAARSSAIPELDRRRVLEASIDRLVRFHEAANRRAEAEKWRSVKAAIK